MEAEESSKVPAVERRINNLHRFMYVWGRVVMARYDGRSTRRNKKTSNVDSQEYWENILRQEGLSMSRGRHARLSYKSPDDLTRIANVRMAKAGAEPDPA